MLRLYQSGQVSQWGAATCLRDAHTTVFSRLSLTSQRGKKSVYASRLLSALGKVEHFYARTLFPTFFAVIASHRITVTPAHAVFPLL